MRKVGPINPAEVRAFQASIPGMQVDGKVGNQTWGEVHRIVHSYRRTRDENKRLRDDLRDVKAISRGMAVVWLAVAIAFQVMFL